jgi:hypothetical protein
MIVKNNLVTYREDGVFTEFEKKWTQTKIVKNLFLI